MSTVMSEEWEDGESEDDDADGDVKMGAEFVAAVDGAWVSNSMSTGSDGFGCSEITLTPIPMATTVAAVVAVEVVVEDLEDDEVAGMFRAELKEDEDGDGRFGCGLGC